MEALSRTPWSYLRTSYQLLPIYKNERSSIVSIEQFVEIYKSKKDE